MIIINKEKEVCKELWTRMQDKERAVLDYVLTNIKLLSTITEMIIDENKRYGVFNDKWSEDVQNKIKEVEKILRQNPRKNINAIKKKEENAEKTILKQQMYM